MDTVESLYTRLEQLNDIGTSLSGEHDIDCLLEKILLAVKGITHADGGTLYTLAPDGRYLNFRIVRTDSLGIAYGGQGRAPLPGHFKDLPLYLDDGQPNDHMVAAHVFDLEAAVAHQRQQPAAGEPIQALGLVDQFVCRRDAQRPGHHAE